MRALPFSLVLVAGCAQPQADAQLRDLRARLEASERNQAEATRKLDDLDNRVFLLTDQVESQKLLLQRRSGGEPRLPVITLAPAVERDDGAGDAAPEAATVELRVPEKPAAPMPPTTIAAGSDGRRPSLKLKGNTTPWLADSTAGATATSGLGVRPGAVPYPPVDAPPARSSQRSRSEPRAEHRPEPKAEPRPERAQELGEPADGEPTVHYRAAYDKLKVGQIDAAAEEFRAFVKRFPRSDLADNAQYWLGETYYAQKAYSDAAPEFRTVLRRWPAGNKAPDALLKLGYCLLALGDGEQGRAALSQLVELYPKTDAALLAKKRLDELAPPEKKL